MSLSSKQDRGGAVGDYRAPLFLAWQITNRCDSRCLHCLEESGPDRGWPDELDGEGIRVVVGRILEAKVPYVAFGGGEPLAHPNIWEALKALSGGGVELKIETNGHVIVADVARRLADLKVKSVQVSLDGARPETHAKVRPSGDFSKATQACRELLRAGLRPEIVFVPTSLNIEEASQAADLAFELGASAFYTGPMMRLGRAAFGWRDLAPSAQAYARMEEALRAKALQLKGKMEIHLYPCDILEDLRRNLGTPPAMLLVVPNGKVKLMNALPFVCGDLVRQDLKEVWESYLRAWRLPEVQGFARKALADPSLLGRANRCEELALFAQ